jgi:hypothetical protein
VQCENGTKLWTVEQKNGRAATMTTISLAGALFILLLAPVAITTMMLLTNADLFDRIPLKDENQAY